MALPPSTSHGFIYPEPGTTWISAKFTCPAEFSQQVIHMDHAHNCQPLRDGLQAMLNNDAAMTPPLRLATEGIIEALVFAARLKPHAKQSETLADKVIDFVYARSEQQITIAELADEMGYSPGYLSAMFRKQQGEPLKAFLDRIRGENAAHHLCYADLNITQIAQRMGFPDVYSFSRFCKRVLGESPKQLQGRRPPNT